MPIRASLLSEIQSEIAAIGTSNLSSSSAVDNIYEVYLLSLILRAVSNEGGTSTFENIQGGGSLFFRSSPGYINSIVNNYSYSEIIFPGKPALEAHVSIRCVGHSLVPHECDICVLLKSEAELCRLSSDRVAPRSSKIIISVEAKYYTTSLGLHLGRSFLGLTADFSADKTIFVSNTNSRSIEKLLTHKKKLWEHNIVPTNTNDVNRLVSIFQTAFKDFKAK